MHSLSKRSNLAGYRAGFVTGDPGLIARLLEIRKHAGMMMPAPVQAAMAAALDDDEHADQQRAVYAARRDRLLPAFQAAGWQIAHSEAGLYLWASAARPGRLGLGPSCWPRRASWSPRASSTARPAPSTSGSRSPPPTSASTPRCERLAELS